METARMNVYIHAPVERVWAALTDYASYARLPKVESARVLQQGRGDPAGVGAVREVRLLGSTFVEEITRFEAPRLLGYQILRSAPLPIEHRGGEMELVPRGEGTEVRWTTTFRVAVPLVGGLIGKVTRAITQNAFNDVLLWLKDELEREAQAQPDATAARAVGDA
jgi:uncharacterized protein YndB with AHSA1/START domain